MKPTTALFGSMRRRQTNFLYERAIARIVVKKVVCHLIRCPEKAGSVLSVALLEQRERIVAMPKLGVIQGQFHWGNISFLCVPHGPRKLPANDARVARLLEGPDQLGGSFPVTHRK